MGFDMIEASGAVAQLGARETGSLEVRGSTPLSSTNPSQGVAVKLRSSLF